MSKRGWVVTFAIVILLFLWFFMSGGFMHGDCIEPHKAPPC